MNTSYVKIISTSLDNSGNTFPDIYYGILPNIIPYDIKHKILELYFRKSVNTIISIWRKNIKTIRYNRHLKWLKYVNYYGFENSYNIPLLKRQNAKENLLA